MFERKAWRLLVLIIYIRINIICSHSHFVYVGVSSHVATFRYARNAIGSEMNAYHIRYVCVYGKKSLNLLLSIVYRITECRILPFLFFFFRTQIQLWFCFALHLCLHRLDMPWYLCWNVVKIIQMHS